MNSNKILEQESISIAFQLNVIEQSGYSVAGIRDNVVSVFSRAFQEPAYRDAVRRDVEIILYHLDNIVIYIMRTDEKRVLRTLEFVETIAREAVNRD